MRRYLVAGLLVLVAWSAPLSGANAAILFAGGEDTSFTLIGAALGTGIASSARSGYARSTSETVSAFNSTTVADPPANRIQTTTFTAGSLIWVHAQFYPTNLTTSTLNEQGMLLRSPDGVSRLIVRQTGTFGTIKVSSRNSAGTITDLGTSTAGAFTNATISSLDMKVDYSVSGGVTLYINGAAVITFSGDPRTDAATQLNQVEFSSLNNSGGNGTYWSEVIIADEDTRGMALHTACLPAAAGNTQGWTPNTLANVQKATINDATLISVSTQPTLSEWTCTTSAPSGSWSVKAVELNARLEVGTTGPQTATWAFRINGTDYTTGAISPSTSFGNAALLQATSPASGSAWDLTNEIYKAGFNVGVQSGP